MNTKNGLIVSALINVGLIASLAWFTAFKQPQPEAITSPVETGAGPADSAIRVRGRSGSGELTPFSELAGLGLGDERAKRLWLQMLRDEYVGSIPFPNDEYWKPDLSQRISEYLVAENAATDVIREELLEEFGSSATTDPVFRDVFRPLEMQHPYLSSADQIALRKFQVERQAEFLALTRNGSPALPPGITAGMAAAPSGMTVTPTPPKGVESFFDRDTAFEYNLRASPTANKLRAVDVQLSESEFREVFRLLEVVAAPSARPADPGAYQSAFKDLKKTLGETGAVRVWASFDTSFAALKVAAESARLDDSQLNAAYEILSSADNQILQAYRIRQDDPEGSTQLIQRAMRDRNDSLSRLLGSEAADSLLQARIQANAPRNPTVNPPRPPVPGR